MSLEERVQAKLDTAVNANAALLELSTGLRDKPLTYTDLAGLFLDFNGAVRESLLLIAREVDDLCGSGGKHPTNGD